jgi:hypothetical protein
MKILEAIDNGPGYIIKKFNLKEAEIIRNNIIKKYNTQLKKKSQYCHNKIEDYHKLNISDKLHKQIWDRESRRVSKETINYIKKTKLFYELKKEFGKLEFSKKVSYNKPDIFWRLVRPKKNDIGGIHADKWFWQANKWLIPKNKRCLKVWMLLSKSVNKGLGIVPYSHTHNNWIYKKIFKDGIFKPRFDLNKNKFNLKEIFSPFGTCIIFNYNLLHTGLINKFKNCRVSLEFTLFYNKN